MTTTSVSNPNGQIIDEENSQGAEQTNIEDMLNSVNNNNNSNVGDVDGEEVNNNNNNNNNYSNGLSIDTQMTTNDDTSDDNNNNNATTTALNLQQINENGIIRVDMSQIIDSTGLPTYEAAIKLEQSGYV